MIIIFDLYEQHWRLLYKIFEEFEETPYVDIFDNMAHVFYLRHEIYLK